MTCRTLDTANTLITAPGAASDSTPLRHLRSRRRASARRYRVSGITLTGFGI